MKKSIARTIAIVATLLLGGMFLAGWMGLSAIRNAHQRAMESAISVVIDDIARSVEASARLGIAPAEQVNLHAMIAAESVGVPMLQRISILDDQGAVLTGSPPSELEPRAYGELRRAVLNDLSAPVAVIVAHYDPAPIRQQMATLGRALLAAGAITSLVLGLLAALIIRRSVTPIHRLVRDPDAALAASAPLAALDRAIDRIEAGMRHG